jgi:hypothetical protein
MTRADACGAAFELFGKLPATAPTSGRGGPLKAIAL